MGTRDELTGVGSLFRFDTEQHLLRDLLPQQVARHDVANTELIAYPQCLCVLARAGQSNKGKIRGV